MTLKILKEDIAWSLKLYSLIFVLPVLGTAMYLVFSLFFGPPFHMTFFEGLFSIWIKFFFTGEFMGVLTYKFHIVLILISFFFIITSKK